MKEHKEYQTMTLEQVLNERHMRTRLIIITCFMFYV